MLGAFPQLVSGLQCMMHAPNTNFVKIISGVTYFQVGDLEMLFRNGFGMMHGNFPFSTAMLICGLQCMMHAPNGNLVKVVTRV